MVFSQGFNPRPRIQFAAPLPLGFTSDSEIMDVWLEDDNPDLDRLREDFFRSLPPGLLISEIYPVKEDEPALQNILRSAVYRVTLLEPVNDIVCTVNTLLAAQSLPRMRRGQDYDLRPLIESLEVLAASEDKPHQIRMELSAREGRTGRPEEVLAVLGIPFEKVLIKRERLVFECEE